MSELSAGDWYMTWMRGWSDGASCRAKRQEFIGHANNEFASVYLGAYERGMQARGLASIEATERSGYQPSILRATPSPDTEKGAPNGT